MSLYSGYCLGRQMSWMLNILGGKCLYIVAIVLGGKCLGCWISWVANVSDGKHLRWQVVKMANVSWGICFVRRRVVSVLEAFWSGDKSCIWQKFRWKKCLWQYWWMATVLMASCMGGKCLGGICLHTLTNNRQIIRWRPAIAFLLSLTFWP